MPSWVDIVNEINKEESPVDAIRVKYMKTLHEYTGRNIIAYYSAFVHKRGSNSTGIDDTDKQPFMQMMHGLDRSKGLDLILHTPGGNVSTTESLVYYLKQMFGNDIRVIVPQSAFSAGTMIALSSKEIIMGKHSNLGPIDPQFGGLSCAGIIEEFDEARQDILKDQRTAKLWEPIIGKYPPNFIGDCRKAIKWSEEIVTKWLEENMFRECENPKEAANKVVRKLGSHENTYDHSRPIHMDELRKLGLNIKALENMGGEPKGDCVDIQDCILTIHHCFTYALLRGDAIKMIENHTGKRITINESSQRRN